ncbi:MAG: aminopeptidase [Leptospira sp.]|nr:aminopeptidase [Leptospira sp.]
MKFFLFILFFFNNCALYLSHLGMEQVNQFMIREKIDVVIQENKYDSKTIEMLSFVKEAKSYGIKELALAEDSGFIYFVNLERDEVGWNVSASFPLEFKSYTWWFPIAGEVPYKGFFSYEKAKSEEDILKAKGLDTRIRITGGYSTLGWISDPIFSPQLEWSRPKLAGLVFHEMAHSTVYIPGDSKFNESYANFVEWKGVEKFYENKDDPDYLEYNKNKNLQKKSLELIKETAENLKSIYSSERSDQEKLIAKKETIDMFKEKVISLKLVPEKSIEKFLNKDWNNEDFIGVLRYKSGNKFFLDKFNESNEDFSIFHKSVLEYQNLTEEERKIAMEE